MKKVLIIPILTLFLATSGPAVSAEPPPLPLPWTAVVADCVMSGGYGDDGTWNANQTELFVPYVPTSCRATPTPPNYVGHTKLTLKATGDFACGDGTLTGTVDDSQLGESRLKWGLPYNGDGFQIEVLYLDWTAVFEDGVGTVSGTAVDLYDNTNNQRNYYETYSLSGTIVVDDGAALGQCDDSEGASNVVAHLEIS